MLHPLGSELLNNTRLQGLFDAKVRTLPFLRALRRDSIVLIDNHFLEFSIFLLHMVNAFRRRVGILIDLNLFVYHYVWALIFICILGQQVHL